MTAIVVGKFDALHRGHRALVDAARRHGPPRLLVFAGMAEALGWEPRLPLVAPIDRQEILGDWQAAEVSLPFADVRQRDPAGFAALVRDRLGARALVVGRDFRGGPGRVFAADEFVAAARAAGLAGEAVPLLEDGGVVSSSRIRSHLGAGRVAEAAALLGRPHRLAGTVVRGDGRGRGIGIPTANLGEPESLVPAAGVYAAWARLDGQRIPAVLNIGRLPTIGHDRPQTVEAHLIGWSGDAYGRRLALDLVVRLREERTFPGLDALVAQIRADIAAARELLR